MTSTSRAHTQPTPEAGSEPAHGYSYKQRTRSQQRQKAGAQGTFPGWPVRGPDPRGGERARLLRKDELNPSPPAPVPRIAGAPSREFRRPKPTPSVAPALPGGRGRAVSGDLRRPEHRRVELGRRGRGRVDPARRGGGRTRRVLGARGRPLPPGPPPSARRPRMLLRPRRPPPPAPREPPPPASPDSEPRPAEGAPGTPPERPPSPGALAAPASPWPPAAPGSPVSPVSPGSAQRTPWSARETELLLGTLLQPPVWRALLLDRRQALPTYRRVSAALARQQVRRTPAQCRRRYKFLKDKLRDAHGQPPGPFDAQIRELMGLLGDDGHRRPQRGRRSPGPRRPQRGRRAPHAPAEPGRRSGVGRGGGAREPDPTTRSAFQAPRCCPPAETSTRTPPGLPGSAGPLPSLPTIPAPRALRRRSPPSPPHPAAGRSTRPSASPAPLRRRPPTPPTRTRTRCPAALRTRHPRSPRPRR